MKEEKAKMTGDSLTDEHTTKVCKRGCGEQTCSFLGFSGGWACTKGTSIEKIIRERREAGTMGAKGDNCSGPDDFKPTKA